MKKKTVIIIGCATPILLFVIACIIIIRQIIWANSPHNYKHSSTYSSGCYTIIAKQSDPLGFFGPSNVKIIAENTDTKDKKEFYAGISDDGARGNIDVKFCENNADGYDAVVTLSGSEMKTKIINIEMDDEIRFDALEED